MHCVPQWTPHIADKGCDAVRDCMVTKHASVILHSGAVDPPAKIDIRITVPTARSTKHVYATIKSHSEVFSAAERESFASANQAAYEACIATLPICATHQYFVECSIQPDGSGRDCNAAPTSNSRGLVDPGCGGVGDCMKAKTTGIESKGDAGVRHLTAYVEFSGVKPRKPD